MTSRWRRSVGRLAPADGLPGWQSPAVGTRLLVEYMSEQYPVTVASHGAVFDPSGSRMRGVSGGRPGRRAPPAASPGPPGLEILCLCQAGAHARRRDHADPGQAGRGTPGCRGSRSARTGVRSRGERRSAWSCARRLGDRGHARPGRGPRSNSGACLPLGATKAVLLRGAGPPGPAPWSSGRSPRRPRALGVGRGRRRPPYALVLSATRLRHLTTRLASGWRTCSNPVATGIKSLAVADGATSVEASREYRGVAEKFRLPLPAVTVKEGINLPRYPSLPGRLRAKRAVIERVPSPIRARGPCACGGPAGSRRGEALGDRPRPGRLRPCPSWFEVLTELGMLA